MPVGSGVRLFVGPDLKLILLVCLGWIFSFIAWSTCVHTGNSHLLRFSVMLFDFQVYPPATQDLVSVKSSSLIHHGSFRDLFVVLP